MLLSDPISPHFQNAIVRSNLHASNAGSKTKLRKEDWQHVLYVESWNFQNLECRYGGCNTLLENFATYKIRAAQAPTFTAHFRFSLGISDTLFLSLSLHTHTHTHVRVFLCVCVKQRRKESAAGMYTTSLIA